MNCIITRQARAGQRFSEQESCAPSGITPEQPVALVWFTTNPIYDFGCLKKLDLSTLAPGQVFDHMVQEYGPLYRVVVPVSAAPLSYRDVIQKDVRHRHAYQTFFVQTTP